MCTAFVFAAAACSWKKGSQKPGYSGPRPIADHACYLKPAWRFGLGQASLKLHTIFAPTNDAFAKLPSAFLGELRRLENKPALRAMLNYHALPQEMMKENFRSGMLLTRLAGAELHMKVDVGSVTLRDSGFSTADITGTDMLALNGAVHTVDTVLMPAELAELLKPMLQPDPVQVDGLVDVAELLAWLPQFSTFVSLLGTTGLLEDLHNGLVTVLPPTEDARRVQETAYRVC